MTPAASPSPSTSTSTPERSLDQRKDALLKANEVRTRRAQLKRDLKSGRVTLADLLLDPPEWVHTAKVLDMLLAVPKYGRVRAMKVLNQCRVSAAKTVNGLTERQRQELVAALRQPRR